MTICISAICTEKEEEHIVFAVDHMITTANGEFEHAINKYQRINKNTVGMVAGDALLMEYFMDLEDYNGDYENIQNSIQKKFKTKRKEMVEKNILDTFFVDIDFIKENLSEPINNPIVEAIFKKVIDTKLNSAVLLIGFGKTKAQISEIGDNGISNFRTINFHTIGSGAVQAQNTLLFQKQSRNNDLPTTLYNVYKAKKNAEVKPGVGEETEIGYLNKNKIIMLNEKNINILDDIYIDELNYGKKHQRLKRLEIE